MASQVEWIRVMVCEKVLTYAYAKLILTSQKTVSNDMYKVEIQDTVVSSFHIVRIWR